MSYSEQLISDLSKQLQENSLQFEQYKHQIEQTILSNLEELDLKKHPYENEQTEITYWMQLDQSEFYGQCNSLLDFIDTTYSDTQINTKFFRIKINEKSLRDYDDQSHYLLLIRKELLERWWTLLNNKVQLWYLKQLEHLREDLLDLLSKKLERLSQLEDIVDDSEFGSLWNMASGAWKESDFVLLNNYKQLLQEDASIQSIVDELGRGNSINQRKPVLSNELSEEGRNGHQFGKEQIFAIKESDELNCLLHSELGLLTDESLEIIFYHRWVQKKLLSFDMNGSLPDLSTSEIPNSPTIQENGPVVICIDTSGSMKGIPETIAKTLTFAIAQLILKEKRPCYIIAFSTQITTYTISQSSELSNLLDFLRYSFNGGTSFDGPMKEVSRIINSHKNYCKADVLIISDFVLASLSNYTTDLITNLKNQRVKLYSLIISTSINHQILTNFSKQWQYNPDGSPILTEL